MSQSTAKASVLLVGAYERDNFGDLLFYQLTKDYLEGSYLAAGSVIGADMRPLLGTRVYPHSDLLAARAWDLVWVVGGEIGGVDTEGALAMSLTEADGSIFDQSGKRGKGVIAEFLSGASAQSPAYFPPVANFPLNTHTPVVMNSIGLSNLFETEPGSEHGDAAHAAIRNAAAVVVRDTASQRFAASIGKTATLSPDMVHAISLRHPEIAQRRLNAEPYFVFQANAHLIQLHGAEAIARSIARVARATNLRPAFFLAGTARHHDRSDQYDEVKSVLAVIAPEIPTVGITTRDPMLLASYIARSRMWIGSSLHGRIIAGSFGLPRVSLENRKVSKYAATWDPAFPMDVSFDDLPEAVVEAFTSSRLPRNAQDSRDCANAADQQTQALVETFR
ncbi:polysaccharide pyruvyl transferase family protein [Cryobacterium mannosilyticum]|uniref:polysaccharide pyruvyl transferase family protein n=1 Tax=Cryobacterium mannosilyticum TaxID=1259190 RepID=UPI00141B91B3|nr:polysaccharide pyruvyl transferase family protein [Cryobacterium mannosilyticum]